MDTYRHALFTKYNSTNTSCNYIGKISYMKCECHNFSFDPKLYVYLFPFFSKAEIRMTPFSEAKSDITDFEMTVSPTESLIITKSNISNVFINYLSKLNLCQRYSVNGMFQLDQSSFKRKFSLWAPGYSSFLFCLLAFFINTNTYIISNYVCEGPNSWKSVKSIFLYRKKNWYQKL